MTVSKLVGALHFLNGLKDIIVVSEIHFLCFHSFRNNSSTLPYILSYHSKCFWALTSKVLYYFAAWTWLSNIWCLTKLWIYYWPVESRNSQPSSYRLKPRITSFYVNVWMFQLSKLIKYLQHRRGNWTITWKIPLIMYERDITQPRLETNLCFSYSYILYRNAVHL